MRALPESNWLTLQEAAEKVLDETGAAPADIGRRLVEAFKEEKIRVVARCYSWSRSEERTEVSGSAWDRATPDWANNQFTAPSGGRYPHVFKDVGVHRDDLMKWLSQVPDAAATQAREANESNIYRPDYRSPFVDLILEAEDHFRDRLKTAKAVELQQWLSERGTKIDPQWSQNKTEMMATFLRHPDRQKGGNRPGKSRT